MCINEKGATIGAQDQFLYGRYNAEAFIGKPPEERAGVLIEMMITHTQIHEVVSREARSLVGEAAPLLVVDVGGSYTCPLYLPRGAEVTVIDPGLDQAAVVRALGELNVRSFRNALPYLKPDSQDWIADYRLLRMRMFGDREDAYDPVALFLRAQEMAVSMGRYQVMRQKIEEIEVGGGLENRDMVVMSLTYHYVPENNRRMVIGKLSTMLRAGGKLVLASLVPPEMKESVRISEICHTQDFR